MLEAGLKWSEYQQKYGIKRGGKTQWMTLEELIREYRGIVERIPAYMIEAAKWRIRVNGIKEASQREYYYKTVNQRTQ
jgi:hypothetical protein